MKRGIFSLVLISLLVLCACESSKWGLEGGALRRAVNLHTSQIAELGLGEPLWGGQIIPDREVKTLYAMGGDLYGITANHEIHAIGPKGRHKWIFTHHQQELDAAPCVNDKMFCFFAGGNLYVLGKEGGGLRINRRVSVSPSCDPVATPTTLFYGGWIGESVYTVDLETGRAGWNFRTGDHISTPLALSGSLPVPLLHVASEGASVYTIPAVHSSKKPPLRVSWEDGTAGLCRTGMASDAKYLYVATQNNGLIAYNRMSGGKVWTFFPAGISASKPVVFGSAVYVKGRLIANAMKKALYAVDTKTGRLNWKVENGDRVLGKLGNRIFVLEEPFRVHVIDELTGIIYARAYLDQFDLFVSAEKEGILYFGNSDGFFYAVNEVKKEE